MGYIEWQKGAPDKSGYYLVAWKRRNNHVIVSELWYNPDAIYSWWFIRTYANQKRLGGLNDAMREEVIAWMPMPDPPKD